MLRSAGRVLAFQVALMTLVGLSSRLLFAFVMDSTGVYPPHLLLGTQERGRVLCVTEETAVACFSVVFVVLSLTHLSVLGWASASFVAAAALTAWVFGWVGPEEKRKHAAAAARAGTGTGT